MGDRVWVQLQQEFRNIPAPPLVVVMFPTLGTKRGLTTFFPFQQQQQQQTSCHPLKHFMAPNNFQY